MSAVSRTYLQVKQVIFLCGNKAVECRMRVIAHAFIIFTF